MIYAQALAGGFDVAQGKGGHKAVIEGERQHIEPVAVLEDVHRVGAVLPPAVGHEDVIRGDRGQGTGSRGGVRGRRRGFRVQG